MKNREIIETYTARKMTIREMAKKSGRSYEDVRKILLSAGFHNGKV